MCGAIYEDDGLRLECSAAHSPALLVSDYEQKKLTLFDDQEGLYRYRHWLPSETLRALLRREWHLQLGWAEPNEAR